MVLLENFMRDCSALLTAFACRDLRAGNALKQLQVGYLFLRGGRLPIPSLYLFHTFRILIFHTFRILIFGIHKHALETLGGDMGILVVGLACSSTRNPLVELHLNTFFFSVRKT